MISGNLFRTRDTFRQDIIDNSNLILALARPPPPTLPATAAANPVAVELATNPSLAPGVAVDPLRVSAADRGAVALPYSVPLGLGTLAALTVEGHLGL